MYRIALVLVLIVCAGCADPHAPDFISREHKFKARFGGVPTLTENAGETRSAVYSVESAAGALVVTVTALPIPDDDPPDRAPLYLVSAKDDLIRGAGGTPTEDAAITLAGKYPGRAFAARFGGAKPGALRARIFLVGKRLYQVTAIGTEAFVNADPATVFLESFMVASEG